MPPEAQIGNGLIMLGVVALIVYRTLRTQTVRVWALIALPIVMLFIALSVVAATPPGSVVGVGILAGGAIAGAALGYARGIHSRVKLGPRPGTLVVQGNVLLVAILISAFALRFAVRWFIGVGDQGLALSDAFIVFATASVGVARLMLFFNWRRLVASRTA